MKISKLIRKILREYYIFDEYVDSLGRVGRGDWEDYLGDMIDLLRHLQEKASEFLNLHPFKILISDILSIYEEIRPKLYEDGITDSILANSLKESGEMLEELDDFYRPTA